MGYHLARDWSGVTAKATESKDSISTPILVPNIQYNLECASYDHCLLEQVAFSSALISKYLFWDTFCLVLFQNNWKHSIFTVTSKRLTPKHIGGEKKKKSYLYTFFHLENRNRNISYASFFLVLHIEVELIDIFEALQDIW